LTCPGGAGTQGLPCGAAYPFNTVVTLTAVPDTGSAFGGWSGACSGSGACQVTLDQARFVAALFTKTADTPTTSYYHVDAQGSVRAISDDSGAIVIRHDYYTFGEDAQPLTGDPLRYAGKELDPETAQEYFGARYYRNVWGRFGTVDPVYSSAAVTDPQQWNRYAYARNNPLKFSDPLGATIACHAFGNNVACDDGYVVSGDPTDPFGYTGTVTSGNCIYGFVYGALYWWQCRPGSTLDDPYEGGDPNDGGGGGGGGGGSSYTPPGGDATPPAPNAPSSGNDDNGGNNDGGSGQQKDNSDPCKGPQAPPGESALTNAAFVRSTVTTMGWVAAAAGWVNAVRDHGIWDYKNSDGGSYANFGNYNYGATSRALGLPVWLIHLGAAGAQVVWGPNHNHWHFSDDAKNDTPFVNDGIAAFDRGCLR
jgi:RHS repeat-associated protein